MTGFWFGVIVGAGAGALAATILMLVCLARTMRNTHSINSDNWKKQLINQGVQIEACREIARAINEKRRDERND